MHFKRGIKETLQVVDSEDAAVADAAALVGGKQLDVAPTTVKIVSQGDTISDVARANPSGTRKMWSA